MATSKGRATPFTGVRMRFDSDKNYEQLVAALLADIGQTPVPLNDFAPRTQTWDEYQRLVEPHVGPSGFMLFALFDHGAWLQRAGIDRKVLRVILGNPLIAITMLRHDVTAGLFAPVEVLVVEEADDRSSLTYVAPSSLMVFEPNPPLLAAAQELDNKLEALATAISVR